MTTSLDPAVILPTELVHLISEFAASLDVSHSTWSLVSSRWKQFSDGNLASTVGILETSGRYPLTAKSIKEISKETQDAYPEGISNVKLCSMLKAKCEMSALTPHYSALLLNIEQAHIAQAHNQALTTIWPRILQLVENGIPLEQLPLPTDANAIRAFLNNPAYAVELQFIRNLDLSNLSLRILSPEIGLLVGLRKLNLSRNRLTSLPPEIGLLVTLRELNLSHNKLTSLPPEAGLLVALRDLTLSNNWRLTSFPPQIGLLVALKALDLSNNRLTSLPPEIGQLAELEWLWLFGNQFASLPPEMGQLTARVVL